MNENCVPMLTGGNLQVIGKDCNCVANVFIETSPDGNFHRIVEGLKVILQVPASTSTSDTDTRLSNPHFGTGAPAGFQRLFYDLYSQLPPLK